MFILNERANIMNAVLPATRAKLNKTNQMSKVTPIIYDGPMFKRLRINPPEIKLYGLIKLSGVSRQQITKFEAGNNDIRLSTLTKLLTALYELKYNSK